MKNQGTEQGSNQGQWHMGRDVICPGEPTDLSGLPHSCFPRMLVHNTYFKMKQSSLNTVNHSSKFTFVHVISWSPSVPCECIDSSRGHLPRFILAQRVDISCEFLISSCSLRVGVASVASEFLRSRERMFVNGMLSSYPGTGFCFVCPPTPRWRQDRMAAAWARHTEMTSPAHMGGARAVVILGSWRVI